MASKAPTEPTDAGQQTEGEATNGFAEAFAERAQDPQRDDTQQPEETDDQGPESSEQEPAQAGSTEVPAEAATEATGSGTEGQQAPPAPQPFNPFAGLSPEQLSYFKRLEASDRSNRGRVSALQRKQRTATAPRAAEAPQQDQSRPQAQTETGEGTSGEASTAKSLEERLNTAVEEYGEIVGPVADILKEVRAEIASMKGTVSQVEEAVSEQELTEAYEALEEAHPDFADLAADANFNAWLSDQPEGVIALANSFDPREVSLSLTLFKTERAAALGSQTAQAGEEQTQQGAQPAAEAQGQQASTATDTKRQRQLEGSKATPARSQPAAAGTPNDFGSAFKARAAQHADSR